jgi:hypothetical protein
MKYLSFFFILLSSLISAEEIALPTQIPNPGAPKNISFSKLLAFEHIYIVFLEQREGAEMQIKHDPSCPCRKLKEEHLAQIINELVRLQKTQRV